MRKADLHNKINDFFFGNPAIRAMKVFFHQRLKSIAIKFLLLALTFLVLTFLVLKIVKPSYLDSLYHQSSFSFYKYLNLDNKNYSKINISGNKYSDKEKILAVIKNTKNLKEFKDSTKEKYQPLIQEMTLDLKNKLPWVDQVKISRNISGNIINVEIIEYEPFALWYHENKKYVTDKRGNVVEIENIQGFEDLIIVSGLEANLHVKSLFNIFAVNPTLSSKVYSATWSGNRRWDIRLSDGILVKLPESNISDAWDKLIQIYNLPGSTIGLKVIDLRIADKTYLQYDDSVIKEIKDL